MIHRNKRFFYYSKPLGLKQKRIIKLIIVIIIITAITMSLLSKLKELTIRQAEWEISTFMTELMNQAINEKMLEGKFNYNDMITLEKDNDGNVTALVTNMTAINQLQADLVNSVIDLTNENSVNDIHIPLGNIIGGSLFSGRGPTIPIKIVSLTSVIANFSNEFSDAGINQTRHRIKLTINVELSFLISGYTAATTSTTEVIVAETVIVGNVPGSYTIFEGESAADSNEYMYYAID